MKKLGKILLIIVCMFLAICQTETKAYTLDEVKQIVNFKVAEDNENIDFDIVIYGSELKNNAKIPCIRTSIEDVLYSKENLLNIDFFGIFNSEEKNALDFISNLVKSFFKIFLYITIAAMITLLIYIGINFVISAISKKKGFIPLGKVFGNKKDKKTTEFKKEKDIIEQWLISVFILILIVYVMNLLVALSYRITELSDKGQIENEKVVLYVKDATLEAGSDISYMAFGDSVLVCPVDSGYVSSEFGYREPPIEGISNDHKGIDIAVPEGTEVMAAEEGTVTVSGWSDSAGYWITIDHGNGFITKYMHNKENGLLVNVGDKVKKGQVIALAGSTGQSTGSHCHFQIEQNGEPVNPRNFQYGNGPLSPNGDSGNRTVVTSGKKISYTFETNLEGMLMFLSQRDWDEYTGINIGFILVGFIITLFKWVLYALFFIRMAGLAVLTTFAPIIILINAFMKVNGSNGILGNWFKVYIYLILLRPIIGILYYVLAESNPNIIIEHPFYMLTVILVILLYVAYSSIKLIKGFKETANKNIVRKNS